MLNTTENSTTLPTLHNGRFVISGVLGKGGNARVYTAYDTVLRAWRAVKVLSPAFIDDPEVRARFSQEAAAMARLEHPHIVKIYDISDDPYTPHIVMELCEAGAVIDWMKAHGAVPPQLALHVIRQIAVAVQHAHAFKLVHRDIKPQNILIDQYGIAKLTDFGIAQADDSQLTQAGSTIGTYAFMAPEQRHDATSVDERADVYSLGATLFTMSKVQTTTELFVAERDDAIFEGLPGPLVEFILRACAYRPRDRYQDVGELIEAIDEIKSVLPPDPEDTPPIQALARKLPARPPDDLPNLDQLEDLLKALALSDTQNTGSGFQTTLGNQPAAHSYIHESDTAPSTRHAIPATPPPAPSVSQDDTVSARRSAAGKIALASAGGIGILGLVVAAAVVALVHGSMVVSGARTQVRQAERDLVTSVLAAAPAIDRLHDPATLHRLYDQVQSAGPDQAARNARAFADSLERSIGESTPEGDAILLSRNVLQADQRLDAADAEWNSAAGTLTGRIALMLGLTKGP